MGYVVKIYDEMYSSPYLESFGFLVWQRFGNERRAAMVPLNKCHVYTGSRAARMAGERVEARYENTWAAVLNYPLPDPMLEYTCQDGTADGDILLNVSAGDLESGVWRPIKCENWSWYIYAWWPNDNMPVVLAERFGFKDERGARSSLNAALRMWKEMLLRRDRCLEKVDA